MYIIYDNLEKEILLYLTIKKIESSYCLTAPSVWRLYRGTDRVINESGDVGGMTTDWGNQSTQRKPAPGQLCPPQIPVTEPGTPW
jgi:hypothetical protein